MVSCLLFYRGTVEDTEMVDGLVLEQKISHLAGGVSSVEKAKIGLIQFCVSAPKTDVCQDINLIFTYFKIVPSI